MNLRGELDRRVSAHTSMMEWEPSPAAGVHRKRLHRVGPSEAGQVTSVVRFAAGADFHAHDHPDGEEILVLEGTFSDERGDWPEGSYLLSPEGFQHRPFSRQGCTLFVKLRQYGGGRQTVAQTATGREWRAGAVEGVKACELFEEEGRSERVILERWAPGTERRMPNLEGGAEIFVLEGGFLESEEQFGCGSWLRLPHGDGLRATSEEGCRLWMKLGGVARLLSA